MIDAAETQEQTSRLEIVEMLATSLLSRRQEAMEYRAATGVERRWREDEELFDFMDEPGGYSMVERAARINPVHAANSSRSTVKVNIIRAKTEAAVGRFADIAMPTDDRNWGLEPTPVPGLDKQLTDTRPAMQQGKRLSCLQYHRKLATSPYSVFAIAVPRPSRSICTLLPSAFPCVFTDAQASFLASFGSRIEATIAKNIGKTAHSPLLQSRCRGFESLFAHS